MLLSSVGCQPMEAAKEAQLMNSRVLPPKMALPPWLELGHGLMQVPVRRKREREDLGEQLPSFPFK